MSAVPPQRSSIETALVAGHEMPPALVLAGAEEIVCGNSGDHSLIYQLLVAAGHAPSREEFLATQDDPFYEPADRVLFKLGGRIVSHLLTTKRVMHLSGLSQPIAQYQWLVTLPEYRSAGYAARLLLKADQLVRDDGAVLATLHTHAPDLFARVGWIDCGRRTYYRAGAREIRAFLSSQPAPRAAGPLSVRVWRHVELRQLMKLYERAIAGASGPLERTEEYWRWLISRQAYGQIFVAIEGDDTMEFGEQAPKIVGYCVTRDDHIVELIAADNHPGIIAMLLARACREAIERDHHTLRVFVPPGDRLRGLLEASGGLRCDGPGTLSETTMLKLLNPCPIIGRGYALFHARAKEAGIARPCSLQFLVEGQTFHLLLTRRSVRMIADEPGRADIQCSRRQFGQLILGQFDFEAAKEDPSFKTRNKGLLNTLRGLFPPIEYWHPPLDDLQA